MRRMDRGGLVSEPWTTAGSGSKRRVVPEEVEIGVMMVGMNLQIRNVS
ncbi:hypothetical protein FOWG_02445 [Fusarium oxysporum f. sp. lycopersici MN25]|nr:hypothetical protein FOWG_02445 [Fusarium oxysporum f. sp. lycopersici MN25]